MHRFSISNADSHIFGLELVGTARKPVRLQGTSNVEEWELEQVSWRRRFASVLTGPPHGKEIELKYIGKGSKGEGLLNLVIFGKIANDNSGESKGLLWEVWKDLYSMLRVNRDIYSFKPLTNKKDIIRHLQPFKAKYAVEFIRSGIDFRPRSIAGFQPHYFSSSSNLILPSPFSEQASNLIFLSRFLSEYPYPLIVSLRVSPYIGTFPDISLFKTVELKDASTLQHLQSVEERAAAIFYSKEKLCRLRLFVLAENPISETVINTIGCELLSEDISLWQAKTIPVEHDGNTVEKEASRHDYRQVYSIEEASRVFRLPLPGSGGVPGLPVVHPYLPPDLPFTGAVLGYQNTDKGEEAVRIDAADRNNHVYVLGQTGTGKSTLLYSMAMADIREGRGLCVIDPHDDLQKRLIARIPEQRLNDVILLDPADYEYPIGLNLFEYADSNREKSFLANEFIQILRKLYDPHGAHGFTGPVFEQAVRNASLTAMCLPGGGTVVDVPLLLTNKEYTKSILAYVDDERLKNFWNEMWFKYERDFAEMLAYVTSKFDHIVSDPIMRRVLGQAKSSINFRQIMDEGKILLVNLSKGSLGESNSHLLGFILVVKLFAAALSRYDTPAEQRRSFALYIDEFQNFTTDTVQNMLSEARKYCLSMILAHQNLAQLTEATRQTILGNVGSLVFFRPGTHDAKFVQEYLKPYFAEKDLLDMPNWSAVGRIMINSTPSKPFVFRVNKDKTKENEAVVKYIRDKMRCNYARSYRDVDKEIINRQKLND